MKQLTLTQVLSFGLTAGSFLASASPVMAQPADWEEGYCVISGTATIQGLQCLLGNVLSIFVGLIGLIAFVVVIIASFKYMLAGTNTKNVEGSRQAITYAVVGIVVVLAAFIILNVISSFTGIDLTKFVIPPSTP